MPRRVTRMALAALGLGLAATACDEVDRSASTAPREQKKLTRVDPRQVCMHRDALGDEPLAPITLGGKAYFVCCARCAEQLRADPSSRTTRDPVSGVILDKASSVAGATPWGAVLYFESEETLEAYARRMP